MIMSAKLAGFEDGAVWSVSDGVLAKSQGHSVKLAEDPEAPEREALEVLGERLSGLKLLVTPPLARATLLALLAKAPKLRLLLVADVDAGRLALWRDSMGGLCGPVVKALHLPDDQAMAALELEHRIREIRDSLLLGHAAVYVPRRFRRLEPALAEFLERSTLRVQQQICSDAAFWQTRTWHLAMNIMLNAGLLPRGHVATVAGDGRRTAVVVGAGPSLSKNAAELAENAGKLLVIATDASLGALFRHGVTPDFVVTLDDGPLTWNFFAPHLDKLAKVPLVTPLTANHVLLRHYPGPLVFFRPPGFDGWARELGEGLPEIPHGRCVGHLAFHFAERLAPERILLVGSDLAYAGGKSHHDDMPSLACNRRIEADIEVEGFDGGVARTTLAFYFYLRYFEEAVARSVCRVVNCTEGGARVHGVANMPLREAVAALPDGGGAVELVADASIPELRVLAFRGRWEGRLVAFLDVCRRLDGSDPAGLGHGDLAFASLLADGDFFELIKSCGNYLQLTEYFSDAKAGDAGRLRGRFRETLEDLRCAALLLLTFARLAYRVENPAPASTPPRPFLVVPPTDFSGWRSCLAVLGKENARICSPDSSLPEVLEMVWSAAASGLIGFDGNVMPDMWSVPGIVCWDVKTGFEPREYEDSLWLPGYKIICLDAEVYERWKAFVPERVDIELMAKGQ